LRVGRAPARADLIESGDYRPRNRDPGDYQNAARNRGNAGDVSEFH
jgi:hypothetical protein